jgi:hypothetical protein
MCDIAVDGGANEMPKELVSIQRQLLLGNLNAPHRRKASTQSSRYKLVWRIPETTSTSL